MILASGSVPLMKRATSAMGERLWLTKGLSVGKLFSM